MTRTPAPLAILSATCLLVSCRDNDLASYRVGKESATADVAASITLSQPAQPTAARPAEPATTAEGGLPTVTGASLIWTAPADWLVKPAGAMRKGSYGITGAAGLTAELAITAFPGDVGGEVANVNRWRARLQLPPQSAADVSELLTRSTINGLHVSVAELSNSIGVDSQRMLGAIIPFAGDTWFFKLVGPDAIVTETKTAFLEFIQTVKPAPPAS